MPFVIPPVVVWTLSAIGAVAAARWIMQEARRINADLQGVRQGADPVNRDALPKLKPDPVTGVYRPV
jgi:hypothetical protein